MVYQGIAEAYDLLYTASGKDYGREAQIVTTEILSRLPTSRTVLDVGCGTGRHLQYLREKFDVEGLDVSADMLVMARSRLKGIPLHHTDMLGFSLPRQFDAVVCLFSAIGNLYPINKMRQAIENMVAHLVPDGVLIVEPWLSPDTASSWSLKADSASSMAMAVARTTRSWREGNGRKLHVDMQWLIARPTATERIRERHVMGLYTAAEYVGAIEAVGCQATWYEDGPTGRGLVVGVRHTPA